MSGSDGCGASGVTGSVLAGRDTDCGCRVRICCRAGCSCSALWETWSFCCSRTVSRVRMTGENVSESAAAFPILLVSSLTRFCFFRFFRMYSFVLIAGSANCVVPPKETGAPDLSDAPVIMIWILYCRPAVFQCRCSALRSPFVGADRIPCPACAQKSRSRPSNSCRRSNAASQ